MNADYQIGGGWGCHIDWMVDNWDDIDFNKDLLRICGHLPRRPKKGQLILGDFQKSRIIFEIVEVEYIHEPDDMFFANVKAIHQEMK